MSECINLDEHRVAARDEQRQERKLRGRFLQERCEQMPFEVVNGHRWYAPGVGQASPQGGAGQQGPGQPWARGVGDPVDIGRLACGVLESFLEERQQLAYVIAGGELRDHATVSIVQRCLAEKTMREQPLSVVKHGDRRFIAGGFDAQHSHGQFCLLNHTPLESRPFAGALANLSDSS